MFATWDMLPAAVYPVATLARLRDSAAGAHALERAVDGRWLMLEAAPLEGDGAGYVAVTLRNATPKETFDILARAHALTRRERDVVTAVCAGLDTSAITQQLLISRHTSKTISSPSSTRSAFIAAASCSRPSTRRRILAHRRDETVKRPGRPLFSHSRVGVPGPTGSRCAFGGGTVMELVRALARARKRLALAGIT